jgi:hypothetical protein
MPKLAGKLSDAALRKLHREIKKSEPGAGQPVLVSVWGKATEAKVM